MASLSIVVPVYNSEKTVGELVDRLEAHLGGRHLFDIVLVDDGSRDGSGRVLAALAAKHDNVIAIRLSRNFGQHNAILAGLNYATNDLVITMDDDLQHPVEEIDKLVSCIEGGDYDVVYGEYKVKSHSRFKNLGSEMNNLMADVMIKKPRDVRFTSFRIMRSFVVREMIKYKAPYPYVDGLILRITRNIGKVDIRHDQRKTGHSNYTFQKLVRLWMNGFLNFSIVPLRVFSYLGLVIAAFGFVGALIVLVQTLFLSTPPQGWPSLIIAILIFSGVQLMSIGVVGEYVGRIFLTQNGTPQYVVKEPYNATRPADNHIQGK